MRSVPVLLGPLLSLALAGGCALVHVRGHLTHRLPLGALVREAEPAEGLRRGPMELDGQWGTLGRRAWQEWLELEFDCDEAVLESFFADLQLGIEARIAADGTPTSIRRPGPWLAEYEFVGRDAEGDGGGEARLEIVRLEGRAFSYRLEIRWEQEGGPEAWGEPWQ